MDIIIENAEEQLFEDLSAASTFMPELRCIHFKRASNGGNHNTVKNQTAQAQAGGVPSVFITELSTYLNEPEARIFLCHDGDVFVLARDLTQHHLNGFLHHLEAKLGPASFMGLAYLFEAGVDWSKLRVMCERKLAAIKRLVSHEAEAVRV